MAEMNLDTFGEIMDKFIEQNHIQMLIDIPEGTNEPTVKDNTGCGPVMQFYILLGAIKPIATGMFTLMGTNKAGKGEVLDTLFDLLRAEIMEDGQGSGGDGDEK